MKAKKSDKPLRGRPPEGPKTRLAVDIKPELRQFVDDLKARNSWLLNVAVEKIIEAYIENEKK